LFIAKPLGIGIKMTEIDWKQHALGAEVKLRIAIQRLNENTEKLQAAEKKIVELIKISDDDHKVMENQSNEIVRLVATIERLKAEKSDV
jgi:hypothetical protein